IVFITYWKNVRNGFRLQWNLYRTDVDYYLRSQYIKFLKRQKLPISKGEPRMPFKMRSRLRLKSLSLMLISAAVLWGIILIVAQIRIQLMFRFSPYQGAEMLTKTSKISNGHYYSNIIAAFPSAFFVIIISNILPYVVNWIVVLERPRTDSEHIASYIQKLFPLECINNFGGPFQMSLLREYDARDPLVGWTDGGGIHWYNHMCDPTGCAADYGIYLGIFITIKVLFNWILNGGILFYRLIKKSTVSSIPWESDYDHKEVNYNMYLAGLFSESVIKYGLMLMCVHMFPLGPFIIFIDTIVTIRINAKMLCRCLRRNVPRRVVDMEMWDTIIIITAVVGTVAMMYLYVFFSDNVGKLVYQKYLETTLDYFNSTISGFCCAICWLPLLFNSVSC
ncbi:hypothetical protein ILUMI_27497, partial [Ignelater luminosus]